MASIQKISSHAILMSRLSTAVGVSKVKPSSPSSAAGANTSYQVITSTPASVGFYKKPGEISETVEQVSVSLLERLPSKRWEETNIRPKTPVISINNQKL